MAGSEAPAIDGPAGQGAADRAVVVLHSDGRGPFAKVAAGAIVTRAHPVDPIITRGSVWAEQTVPMAMHC